MTGKPLTGRKVLAIAVGFFGVVFAVNIVMATQAIRTFPGLEVDDSYVASQRFNADRKAQEALGWQVRAEVADGALSVTFTDPDGAPVRVARMEATLGHATHRGDDREPDFAYRRGAYVAPVDIDPGNWMVRLRATAPDGTAFRRRVAVNVAR